MSPKDGTSDEPSAHEVDPLSATGMFLSALGAESRPPLQRAPDVFAEPLPKSTAIPPADAERPQAFPGEFTRLFQAAEPSHPAPVQRFPRQTNAPGSELDPAAANSPGEFTRIFVKPPEHAPAPPAAKATPRTESVSKPASAMPRLRGYSSGVSDSASADGTPCRHRTTSTVRSLCRATRPCFCASTTCFQGSTIQYSSRGVQMDPSI